MPDATELSSIAPQLAQATALLRRHLATDLQAVHLFGSAVDGGLKPHSDLDLMVTVATAPAPDVVAALMRDLLGASAPPGSHPDLRALEVTVVVRGDVVPWRHPARRQLQFGEWLRDDLGRGVVEPPTLDHDLAILLTKARAHSEALVGPPAHAWFDPVPPGDVHQALLATVRQWLAPEDWAGDEHHIVLALCRIAYTLATGGIASKDVAARWALDHLPADHHGVVDAALRGYLAGTDEVAGRPADVARFIRAMQARCLPPA